MKRLTAAVVAAAALAGPVAAAPASAATPGNRQVAALQKQVKALQAQVRTLRAQVTVIRKTVDANHEEVQERDARSRLGGACIVLAVSDLFQSTWKNIDERVTTGPAFGPQQQLGDVASAGCGITRPGIQDRPAIDVFSALTGWFIG